MSLRKERIKSQNQRFDIKMNVIKSQTDFEINLKRHKNYYVFF